MKTKRDVKKLHDIQNVAQDEKSLRHAKCCVIRGKTVYSELVYFHRVTLSCSRFARNCASLFKA